MEKYISPAIERYKKIIQLSSSDFKNNLRRERHRHWIHAAENSLNNSHHPKDICLNWSEVTDNIVNKAWEKSELSKFNMSLFALGKWGAKELNLSSDIDFFVISEKPVDRDQQKFFSNFLNLLNDSNEFGFCYRTDIDLRPGGRFGPSINSLLQAQDHYWNSGATWEKLAFVRLRPICGSHQVADEFKKICDSFIYRKYLYEDCLLLKILEILLQQ